MRRVQTASGARDVRLTHVLVVPGFVHNLFSCAHAFQHDGISTLLNDDCTLKLPDGAEVPFICKDQKYTVNLAPAIAHAPAHGKGGETAGSVTDTDMDDDELEVAEVVDDGAPAWAKNLKTGLMANLSTRLTTHLIGDERTNHVLQ